jgi:hypothetical protein
VSSRPVEGSFLRTGFANIMDGFASHEAGVLPGRDLSCRWALHTWLASQKRDDEVC